MVKQYVTFPVCQPCLTALGTEWGKLTYASVNINATLSIWEGPVHMTNSYGFEVTEETDPRKGDSFASPPEIMNADVHNQWQIQPQ